MICLFNSGTLNGLQFEMENPPYRIRVECLEEIIRTTIAAPADMPGPSATPQYIRKSETYIKCNVHLSTEGSLPSMDEELKGSIIVYRLERAW